MPALRALSLAFVLLSRWARFKLTMTSELKDGTSSNYSVACKYDGKECPVTGASYDVVSSKRIDANTTTFETRKTGGKYHNYGKTVISKDGKLTQTITGTAAEGKPMKIMNVFDRQ